MILMLEKMTTKRGIATEGYRTGLSLLKENCQEFFSLIQADPHLMAKFVFYLDVIFQRFCRALEHFYLETSPIQTAKRSLKGKMKKKIMRTFEDLENRIVPALPLWQV